ncbi:4-oxalocrotonate tautomerase family enzyme [Campylobacter ureolyticus ACS-301-V-Sch3b]|uniref:Tautomerase n=1 Tax=Campylobacter ureolyticus ACS-301-V-Sch3b TaxID=883165 RepID=S3XJS3_9BACT|nr:4-oxalocrotonate tautomerase family protein [Campylobacter ureolyticus]EPH10401.1 4-oxalocrotonate tautomerase family enzyme [Campylobacter ureolyticus ACS-301-V-Sch3b]
MPFVKICVTKENNEPTKEQKELLINEVLGKNKSSIVVIIEEIDTDNYGLGGKSITNLRKK